MKYIIFFLLLIGTAKGQDTNFFRKPVEPGKDTLIEQIKILQKKNDSLKEVNKELFQVQLKYQELIANKKEKVIIKEVPVYIDSSKKKEPFYTEYSTNKK